MASETLAWLQDWFLAQCDGDWEHERGVKIDTLDNPGWSLEVDLAGTQLQGLSFEKIQLERSKNDWLFCEVKEDQFKAACGPSNLIEVSEVFRAWVSAQALESNGNARS